MDLPLDSDNESNLWLSLDVEGSVLLGLSFGGNEVGISLSVLIVVLLGIGGGNLSGLSSLLFGLLSRFLQCFKYSGVSLLLLKNVFWDNPGSELQRLTCDRQDLPFLCHQKMLNINK
jgi:hypothetical protein